jgi:cardiolipin synthase
LPVRPYTNGHIVSLVRGGQDFFNELEQLIDSALVSLHFQTYIFDDDNTGKKILKALAQAARRGVKVFLVVDGFGSLSLGRDFPERMAALGIQTRFFSSVNLLNIYKAGRRLHHKVCVADERCALVGGINIADKYRGTDAEKPWLDYAIKVQGPVCVSIARVCERIYTRRFVRIPEPAVTGNASLPGKVKVRMSRNDWMRGKNEISSAYKTMIRTSRSEIIIAASYFIPTRRLLIKLRRAAEQGRQVYLILGRQSDVPFMRGAMHYLYDKLLRQSIRIFEYDEAVLHAKVCVIDRKWVSIGSHNLNHLSEFISVEMNVDVLDEKFGVKVADELFSIIHNHCEEVKSQDFIRNYPITKRIYNRIAYTIISYSMRILDVFNARGRGG